MGYFSTFIIENVLKSSFINFKCYLRQRCYKVQMTSRDLYDHLMRVEMAQILPIEGKKKITQSQLLLNDDLLNPS